MGTANKLHIERTGAAVRKKDEGHRVTMCGLYIGGIGIDPGDVLKPGKKYPWICDNCKWVAKNYQKKKEAARAD